VNQKNNRFSANKSTTPSQRRHVYEYATSGLYRPWACASRNWFPDVQYSFI